MKKLSMEEKAARYDKALRVAKYNYDAIMQMDKDCTFAKQGIVNTFHHMFPELKESEDEMTRKEITEFFKNYCEHGTWKAIPDVRKWIDWLEKQREQTSSQTNELAWLYLVSDVLTWKNGIGQYLDDPRVQELAKELRSEYAQKLYNPLVISKSSNTGNNNQESADKVEPKFKAGDFIRHKKLGFICKITAVDTEYRLSDCCGTHLPFDRQDAYELVEQKSI